MKIQFCIVRFGDDSTFQNNLDTIKRYFPKAEFKVLNNMPHSANLHEIQGSNEAFEFSGYLELLEISPQDGIIILLNDTLFKHHFTLGWLRLLQRFCEVMTVEENIIYGDIRWDGTALLERPNPFLASWLFIIPTKKSRGIFAESLRNLIHEPIPTLSPDYELFLSQWLGSGMIWKGWQGTLKDNATFERKSKCIYWEHQLSAHLTKSGILIYSIGNESRVGYALLRALDRMKIGFWRIACRFKGL